MIDFFRRLFGPKAPLWTPPPEMSLHDMEKIELFAASMGKDHLRGIAIKVHRRNIPVIGVRGNDHQRFMAEVDTPSPDLVERATYRARVLGAMKAREDNLIS